MFYEEHIIHQMHVMNRESSIQLVYQLSILIHNYLNYPAIELVYPDQIQGLASAQWSMKLILQCISAFLSAYSTLSLPIRAEEMRSLKEYSSYCSFWRNFCHLSKRIFQLLCHICSTYITIFFLMESERFLYLRQYISRIDGGKLVENYAFVIYGSVIFLVFPLLVIVQNLISVTILLAGKRWSIVRQTFSRFGTALRTRVKNSNRLFDLECTYKSSLLSEKPYSGRI